MAPYDHTVQEQQLGSPLHADQSPGEKASGLPIEDFHELAERGHAATDRQAQTTSLAYGHPLVTFDPKGEARLRRKIDFYVVPTVFFLYLVCFIDRANIGNARLAGFEKDLHMAGYDFNAVLSFFFISYIVFELPSNLACKYLGPGWFLPATSLGFGLASLGNAFVHNKAQASGVRFLLGVFESGLLPGIAYYLSRWYRRSELAFRLSLYIVSAPLAGAFGGLMASGILKLNSFGTLHRWRMIFAVEGIITIGVSLIAFVILTDRPETARWLSQEEKDLAIARVKSEHIETTEVLDKIDRTKIRRGIFNPVTLATSLIFTMVNITISGIALFLPTIVRSIYPNNSTVSQQLMTVPPYAVSVCSVLLLPWISWRIDRRNIIMIICAPLMITGYIMFLASGNAHVRYGAAFLVCAGGFPYGAMCSAQVSANVISDTARSAAIATNVMIGNLGGLVSTWSFLPFDGPDYPIGNGLNLATSSVIFVSAVGLEFWMRADNKRREKVDIDRELDGLSLNQVQDLDWKHPAFRWKL